MNFAMSDQTVTSRKGFVASVALMHETMLESYVFSKLRPSAGMKSTRIVTALVTLMSLFVLLESRFDGESFATHFTFERQLSGMCGVMHLQTELVLELQTTVGTGEQLDRLRLWLLIVECRAVAVQL
jgi:hypothetical protein